jgi:hypothetical protein
MAAVGAKQTFVAKLTSAKPPRPQKSQLSFDHIGNVATRSLIKETAPCPVCAARFQSSSKAQTPPNDSFERRHPEIELAKQNEIALKLERQQDARS